MVYLNNIEPVVSVDNETDRLINQTIKENFGDSTVIILASRFPFIMESDRIMVMHEGKVIEYDTPLNLLDNPRSKFMRMISQTGDVDVIKLRRIALAKQSTRDSTVRNSSIVQPFKKTTSSCDGMPKSLEGIFHQESLDSLLV